MVTVEVATGDRTIFKHSDVLLEIGSAMAAGSPLVISLLCEGPDLAELGLLDTLAKFADVYQYSLDQVTIETCNMIQPAVGNMNYRFLPPIHFVKNTREKVQPTVKNISKTFGLFVGRSNSARLYLSSYLWNNYRSKTVQTFHYDKTVDYHRNNLGVDDLIVKYPMDGVELFLKYAPLKTKESVEYPMLMNQHCNISNLYCDFFVEIVCESYFSGTTFFPTEKIWRPIAAKTPFIVQGPQHYVRNLHKLGFRTFNSWWDESYTEDHAECHALQVAKIIDDLGKLENDELTEIYHNMQQVLDHNYKRLQTLTREDFDVFR